MVEDGDERLMCVYICVCVGVIKAHVGVMGWATEGECLDSTNFKKIKVYTNNIK